MSIVLVIIMILSDSAVKIDYDYYPQIFLEECKYPVEKENMMIAINKKLNLD